MNQEIEKMTIKEYREKNCLFSSLPELHFNLMNILSFICYNESSYYCFCQKTVEFQYNWEKECCPLCCIPVEFQNFEELLDWNQFNEEFSKKYMDSLLPYLVEFCKVDKRSIKCFIFREFAYSFCDNYAGQK